MFCNQCGKELAPTASFCSRCGAIMKAKSSRKKIAITMGARTVLVVLGVATVLCIGVGLANSNKESDEKRKDIYQESAAGLETVVEDVEETQLTLEEKVDKFLELDANGDSEAAEQQIKEIFGEHGSEPETYLMFANIVLNMGETEDAKELLLKGYEETEDETILEQYVKISLEYPGDRDANTQRKVQNMAKELAGITDSGEKLKIMKLMYCIEVE